MSYESNVKENWKLYYKFKDYDNEKIEISKRKGKLGLAASYIFFIAIVGGILWTIF